MGGPSLAGETIHVVLLMFAPIAWALGSLLARRTKDIGGAHASLVGPALQMLTGGAALLVVATFRGESWPAHASTEAYLSLLYLFTFGSVIGFTAYAWLLAHARPVVATSYAYVNPILAVLLGSAIKGEALGWTTVVANVLIVTAVMLALRRPRSGAASGD
jgi:drug/metabolite transporter (DMT)-like permease